MRPGRAEVPRTEVTTIALDGGRALDVPQNPLARPTRPLAPSMFTSTLKDLGMVTEELNYCRMRVLQFWCKESRSEETLVMQSDTLKDIKKPRNF